MDSKENPCSSCGREYNLFSQAAGFCSGRPFSRDNNSQIQWTNGGWEGGECWPNIFRSRSYHWSYNRQSFSTFRWNWLMIKSWKLPPLDGKLPSATTVSIPSGWEYPFSIPVSTTFVHIGGPEEEGADRVADEEEGRGADAVGRGWSWTLCKVC